MKTATNGHIETAAALALHEVARHAARRSGHLACKRHYFEGDNARLEVDAFELAEETADQIASLEGWDKSTAAGYRRVLHLLRQHALRNHDANRCSVCADLLDELPQSA